MDEILKTDQYKFTMAEAGWPLRTETFYYSHRKGGPHLLPVDPSDIIKSPVKDTPIASWWLGSMNDTPPGPWFRNLNKEAFDSIKIKSLKPGSWFNDRDPVFTATGPSWAVSWLEPTILQLNYRIQIATLAVKNPTKLMTEIALVTCQKQKDIILETLRQVEELGYPTIKGSICFDPIKVDSVSYFKETRKRVKDLVDAVGEGDRIFEVGLRGVSCMEQHLIALKACLSAGVKATSNAFGASENNMKSVGTMGHEHVQRFGSDEAAYRAMVDRIPGPVFFLLDTFDTCKSGIPEAYKIIKEQPERNHAIRFDSGDIRQQFIFAAEKAKKMGISPRYCLEDGWNLEKTIEFEKLREELNLPREQVLYGYGGYIVNSGWTSLTRDNVSAVWKLTQTGNTPTMKFGEIPGGGKESIPGRPVPWYRADGQTYIAQEGEIPDMDCVCGYETRPTVLSSNTCKPPMYSPQTNKIIRKLLKNKKEAIKRNKED